MLKGAVLIIFMRGWSGEAVAIDHIEFDSMVSCQKAIASISSVKSSSTGGKMKYIDITSVCVEN